MIELLWAEWPTLSLLAAGFALFFYFQREGPSWRALLGVACFTFTTLAMSFYRFFEGLGDEALHYQYEIWGTGNDVAKLVYVIPAFLFLIFPSRRPDLLAQLVWLIIILGESWTTVAENVACNFWMTDIPLALQTEAQQHLSKCERIMGEWYSYIPLALELLALWYFARAFKLTRN